MTCWRWKRIFPRLLCLLRMMKYGFRIWLNCFFMSWTRKMRRRFTICYLSWLGGCHVIKLRIRFLLISVRMCCRMLIKINKVNFLWKSCVHVFRLRRVKRNGWIFHTRWKYLVFMRNRWKKWLNILNCTDWNCTLCRFMITLKLSSLKGRKTQSSHKNIKSC